MDQYSASSREVELFKSISKGRQSFLDNHPKYFSRILHDYSEKRKGFIIWKDIMEERFV